MQFLKLLLLWTLLTVIMVVSWSVGSLLGNVATQSTPPSSDGAPAPELFLIVCVFNSLLLTLLLRLTGRYRGSLKWISLTLYLFVIQFGLTQMETWFFSESIGMSLRQILGVLIAGLIMTTTTVGLGLAIHRALYRNRAATGIDFEIGAIRTLILPLLLLACIVYPFIYMIFGYYVAWQNEDLRLFYTHSSVMNPFLTQLGNSFSNGIFFFQMLRGVIWIVFTIPVVLMLRPLRGLQYVLVGIFSALLPGSLLFIPNPYMPAGIAISHFYETATSNFLWGIAITFALNTHAAAIKLKEG